MDARRAIRHILTEAAERPPESSPHKKFNVGGRLFVKPERAGTDVEVVVDVAKFDAAWAQSSDYVGPGGTGPTISNRYEKFQQWFHDNPDVPIIMPEIGPYESGLPGFTNGRHRFAVLRDAGFEQIPVAVVPKYAETVREKYGA
ncbi:hypothetical protein LCGC14_0164220 [marine sediment metagenome]|uniref:ParB/Sulfiredoxin domain-containing protein n=1 Tax=marine sediment metagenome TaxID=412755 RepID=A0A0F9XWL7_9ZZZZ